MWIASETEILKMSKKWAKYTFLKRFEVIPKSFWTGSANFLNLLNLMSCVIPLISWRRMLVYSKLWCEKNKFAKQKWKSKWIVNWDTCCNPGLQPALRQQWRPHACLQKSVKIQWDIHSCPKKTKIILADHECWSGWRRHSSRNLQRHTHAAKQGNQAETASGHIPDILWHKSGGGLRTLDRLQLALFEKPAAKHRTKPQRQ